MKSIDRPRPESPDLEIDGLLREFFSRELPDELPPLPPRAKRLAVPARSSRFPGRLAAAAAAAGIALTAWGLWVAPGTDGPAVVRRGPGESAVEIAAGPGYRILRRTEVAYSASTAALRGASERLDFRWQQVEVVEPISGERLEVSLPEVTMDVLNLTLELQPQVLTADGE